MPTTRSSVDDHNEYAFITFEKCHHVTGWATTGADGDQNSKFSKNYHLPTEFYLIKRRNRIMINSVEITLSTEVIKEEVVEVISLMEAVTSVESLEVLT